jgi:hypothetical protein
LRVICQNLNLFTQIDFFSVSKQSNHQIKLQILKDEMLANKANTSSTSGNKSDSGSTKKHKCGQCEKNLAFTRCLECGEDYCANCFTSFHIKGALQKHRTQPISQTYSANSNNNNSRPNANNNSLNVNDYHNQNFEEELYYIARDDNDLNSNESRSANSAGKHNFLLDGNYDEREAQASFQQALLEWRRSGKTKTKNDPKSNPSNRKIEKNSGVGTDTNDLGARSQCTRQTLQELEKQITKNSNLSYADRLLLEKYRRNDLEFAKPKQNQSIFIVEVIIYFLFYLKFLVGNSD